MLCVTLLHPGILGELKMLPRGTRTSVDYYLVRNYYRKFKCYHLTLGMGRYIVKGFFFFFLHFQRIRNKLSYAFYCMQPLRNSSFWCDVRIRLDALEPLSEADQGRKTNFSAVSCFFQSSHPLLGGEKQGAGFPWQSWLTPVVQP